MSEEITSRDTRAMVETKLDQSIDDPHAILEVVMGDGSEFFDAYAVVAIQKRDDLTNEGFHRWVIENHQLKVTAWGDILQDFIISDE